MNIRNKNSILLLTGPSGAGKSTVAREVAKRRNAIVIDIEHINYMFVNGFHASTTSTSSDTLVFSNWREAGRTIGILADHFNTLGYVVIIHGHVTNTLITGIESAMRIDHKILLFASVEAVITRDIGRGSAMTMGETMIRDHYEYFTKNQFKDFVTLDTTNDTVSQTTARVNKLISGRL